MKALTVLLPLQNVAVRLRPPLAYVKKPKTLDSTEGYLPATRSCQENGYATALKIITAADQTTTSKVSHGIFFTVGARVRSWGSPGLG